MAFETEMRQTVSFLSFAPSVVLWVVFNEAWGQHAVPAFVSLLRHLDPSRLVTGTHRSLQPIVCGGASWMLRSGGS